MREKDKNVENQEKEERRKGEKRKMNKNENKYKIPLVNERCAGKKEKKVLMRGKIIK